MVSDSPLKKAGLGINEEGRWVGRWVVVVVVMVANKSYVLTEKIITDFFSSDLCLSYTGKQNVLGQ